ncbi:MAG: DUF6323 family protein [Clostridia bacterium]|nr:DUF6323 family protein [Clostridia bacterium]
MLLLSIFNSIDPILKETQVKKILQTNATSEKYGLVLTKKDVREIIEVRKRILNSCGRIDLDMEVTKKLIENFCTSAFIDQAEYVAALHDLHEIFYYLKNETEDSISDDALIEVMKDFYENSCGGSMELLRAGGEEMAKDIRQRNQEEDMMKGGEC